MSSTHIKTDYPLYPHQRQVANDILGLLRGERNAGQESVGRRAVAHLPTGAGKTRVAAHVSSELLNSSPHDDRGLLIWLASSGELCEQAAEELQRAWGYLGRWDGRIYRLWGDHETDLASVSGGFLVASLQKLWSVGRRDLQPLIGLSSIAAGIVFDEAHQALAPTFESMLSALLWESPPLVGLTATPGRSTVVGADDRRLAEVFGANKVSIEPKGHPNAIRFLIEGRYLAEPEFHQVHFGVGRSEEYENDSDDYAQEVLERVGLDKERFKTVVDIVQLALKSHRRVMVFCPSVSNATETVTELTRRGLDAGLVAGDTPIEVRTRTIARFRNGEGRPMALVNFGVLTTGFDAPETSCVIVARPTTSVILYSQMIGRGMRGKRVGGNNFCEIYTVVDDDLPGARSLADALNNWEEIWS